jgi:hypothetical protein
MPADGVRPPTVMAGDAPSIMRPAVSVDSFAMFAGRAGAGVAASCDAEASVTHGVIWVDCAAADDWAAGADAAALTAAVFDTGCELSLPPPHAVRKNGISSSVRALCLRGVRYRLALILSGDLWVILFVLLGPCH